MASQEIRAPLSIVPGRSSPCPHLRVRHRPRGVFQGRENAWAACGQITSRASGDGGAQLCARRACPQASARHDVSVFEFTTSGFRTEMSRAARGVPRAAPGQRLAPARPLARRPAPGERVGGLWTDHVARIGRRRGAAVRAPRLPTSQRSSRRLRFPALPEACHIRWAPRDDRVRRRGRVVHSGVSVSMTATDQASVPV